MFVLDLYILASWSRHWEFDNMTSSYTMWSHITQVYLLAILSPEEHNTNYTKEVNCTLCLFIPD